MTFLEALKKELTDQAIDAFVCQMEEVELEELPEHFKHLGELVQAIAEKDSLLKVLTMIENEESGLGSIGVLPGEDELEELIERAIKAKKEW